MQQAVGELLLPAGEVRHEGGAGTAAGVGKHEEERPARGAERVEREPGPLEVRELKGGGESAHLETHLTARRSRGHWHPTTTGELSFEGIEADKEAAMLLEELEEEPALERDEGEDDRSTEKGDSLHRRETEEPSPETQPRMGRSLRENKEGDGRENAVASIVPVA